MIRRPDFFASLEVITFPILNPNGLACFVRMNLDEIDLNRDYGNPPTRDGSSFRKPRSEQFQLGRAFPRFFAETDA
jgi:hypothetical protein